MFGGQLLTTKSSEVFLILLYLRSRERVKFVLFMELFSLFTQFFSPVHRYLLLLI